MTTPGPARLYIEWQRLLDVYQGFATTDEQLAGWLEIDSGTVTCPIFMEGDFERRKVEGGVIRIPVKSPEMQISQRQQFADSCCDRNLGDALDDALRSDNPFFSFDETLESVPIEATRWREELREADQLALERWLSRAGVLVEPTAAVKRTVIEFPLRREH